MLFKQKNITVVTVKLILGEFLNETATGWLPNCS